VPQPEAAIDQEIKALYSDLDLVDSLRFDIFRKAMIGHAFIDFDNDTIITIIDFSRPSYARRCFVINLAARRVLYNTFVAHGRNSGKNYARTFSNIPGSRQSSLGFFRTSDTYMGSNGYSIKLDGLEKNINHLARKREIVMHGADYVSQDFIAENGRLGRSWGCPAFPRELNRAIIDTIKDGSCVYIYADDQFYLENSLYIPLQEITVKEVLP
jgi:hypothetical protein